MIPPMFPKLVAAGLVSYPQRRIKKKSRIDDDTLRRLQSDRKAGMKYNQLAQKYGVPVSYAHKLCLEELP